MLKQRFFVQFGSNIIPNILGLFVGIVVARVAGPDVVGVISYGTAYVSVWLFITGLFGSCHIKLISEGKDLANCMTTYTWLQGGSISFYFVVVAGWFLIQKFIIHYPFESNEQQIVIILTLFSVVLGSLVQFNSLTFTATLQQVKANFPQFIKTILWHVGRLFIVLLGFKAIGLSLWNLVLTILIIPVAYRQIKELPWGKLDKVLMKQYFVYALPIFMIVLVNSLLQYSDKLMLSYYTNTRELGYYSAAYSIGGMFLMISTSVGNIFFPLFSGLIAKNDWKTLNQKIFSYQEIMVLFVLPLVLFMAIISGPFLTTFLGTKYERSIMPFSILLIATFVETVGMPYGNIIEGMGRFYLIVWSNAIKLFIFFFSITVLLSPSFLSLGALGLAINILIMRIVGNLLFIYFANKFGHLSFNKINWSRYVVILIISISFFALRKYFSLWSELWWIIIIPIYFAIIYGSLIITGLLKYSHWLTFIDVINIKKTTEYIRNEWKEKKTKNER